MVVPRLVEGIVVEHRGAVRTQQRELRVGERDVEECLVSSALSHLCLTVTRPDWFADATHTPAGCGLF
jgi:hypothetical protein